jgi:23S rRNA U2552 (ribose-2'-O)-methylase RlmE/FtsJ
MSRKEMSDERMMVALSVLEGKLPPDVLSLDEVIEIQQKLMDLIAKLHQK